MRILGLLTVVVVILCIFTYYTGQRPNGLPVSEQAGNGSAASTYASAIEAARSAVQNSEAEKRRKFVFGMQLTANERPEASRAIENPVYTFEGANSEILVITSNSTDNSLCTMFAKGEYGSAAAGIGFSTVTCRNRTNGAVYDVRLYR